MSDPTNADRARWADAAVQAFNAETGTTQYNEAIGDLIADLGHLAEREGLDFLTLVKNGISHWHVEKIDDRRLDGCQITITIDAPSCSAVTTLPKLFTAAEIADQLCTLITKWAAAEQDEALTIMDEIVGLAQGERRPAEALALARGQTLPLKPVFNHAFDMAFSLESHHPHGEDVTPQMLRGALHARLASLSDDELLEAVGAPFDSYAVDPPAA